MSTSSITSILLVFTAITTFSQVQARPEFQSRIPNGDKVIAPNGEAWPGVGHYRSSGGGDRNPFGLAFAAAGYRWTRELCQQDSDCDGLTNGQELGDPGCVWQEGDLPQFTAGITHPGMADIERSLETSVNAAGGSSSSTCKDFQFQTLPSSYSNTTFTLPNYLVPAQQTTYVKYAFQVDFDGMDSLVVRYDPIVQNPQVVHHMILYHCDSEPTQFLEPNTQGRMPCRDMVASWAVGAKGQCMPPKVGIELDSSRPWYVIDIHYDNPSLIQGIRDSSGLQLTTFPKSAVAGQNYQSAGWLWAGASLQSYSIPPGRNAYQVTATCSYPQLPSSGISVFAYALHAHKIGRKVWTEVYRPSNNSNRRLQENNCPLDCASRGGGQCSLCFSSPGCCGSTDPTRCNASGLCCSACTICDGCQGCYAQTDTCNPNGNPGGDQIGPDAEDLGQPMFDLGCDTRYSFDLQETKPLPEYQTIYASDVLKTHCVYDSTSRTSTTMGGDATDDEMCIAFFLYYPVQPQVKCMTTNVENDAGDGQHTCQIKGLATGSDGTLCSAPTASPVQDTKSDASSFGFGLWIHTVCGILCLCTILII